jgi:predicted metal-dependent hydrolase
MSSTVRSEALDIGLPVPVEIRAMRSARRLRLRFDEASGKLKLTCPARTSRRAALAWALDQRDWVEKQLARAAPPEPFAPDAIIPLEGRDVRITWAPEFPRLPALVGDELRCGGPLEALPRRVTAFLKSLALQRMSDDAAKFAASAGVVVRSIAVGDASSRWGSCSSEERIRLSWRLILAPPEVRRYVVALEVANLKHMNHGPVFMAFEAELFGPGLAAARAELRRLGTRLRRVGRSY